MGNCCSSKRASKSAEEEDDLAAALNAGIGMEKPEAPEEQTAIQKEMARFNTAPFNEQEFQAAIETIKTEYGGKDFSAKLVDGVIEWNHLLEIYRVSFDWATHLFAKRRAALITARREYQKEKK
jgi:hypothetical protein